MSSASNSFAAQFGEKLRCPLKSTEVSPTTALDGKDYVMLYFSAHWCPPCRRFTPVLIELYNKLQQSGKSMELIFCSLDNKENDYMEYTSNMPWLCMPFESKESRILAGKYGAQGIPHLVVIDQTKDARVITSEGTSEVHGDMEGKNFPWKPKSFSQVWPDQILASRGKDGSPDTFLASSEIKDKYLMLYFSASWCPPCRLFTPTLSKFYQTLKSQRNDFELAFVSSDKDEASFNEYYSQKMSFCALPFKYRSEKNELSKRFEVKGIPKLIMLGPEDEDGDRPLINSNVRQYVESQEFSEFPFHEKNYGDVESAAGLNDTKSLVILAENCDDGEQSDIKDVVKEVADKVKSDFINVHWAFSGKGIASQIRKLAKLPPVEWTEDPIMILLDIADNGGCYKSDETDMTVENIMKFLKSPGDRVQLGN